MGKGVRIAGGVDAAKKIRSLGERSPSTTIGCPLVWEEYMAIIENMSITDMPSIVRLDVVSCARRLKRYHTGEGSNEVLPHDGC